MTTSVLSGMASFGNGRLLLCLAENDYDSSSSEMDNRGDSDYSLSDIEEGLDEDAEIDYVKPLVNLNNGLRSNLPRPKSEPCIANLEENSSCATDSELKRMSLSAAFYSDLLHSGGSSIALRNSSCFLTSQETDKHGAFAKTQLLENGKSDKSKLHLNDKMTSFDKREKLWRESYRNDMLRSDLNNQFTTDIPERRGRKQVDSGFVDSCSEYSRSVSDSHSPTREMTTVSDYSADSITSAAVKKWKHYKRAMDAYRKSSTKNDDLSPGNDTIGLSNVMSLPVRVGKNDAERQSIFTFWDQDPDQNLEVLDETTQNGSSNTDGVCLFNPSDKGDMLSFDYRSLLRSKKGSKKPRDSLVEQLKMRDSKRFSVESDVITDIDALAGFSPTERCPNPIKKDTNSKISDGAQPEKIVWSHYDNYFKPKCEVSYISLNDAKKQFPCSGGGSENAVEEAKTRSSLDLRTLPTDDETVNLRDSQLIRKRNLSSSNILNSNQGDSGIPPLPPTNDSQKFYTIASSARLAKLLKRQQRRSTYKKTKTANSSSPDHDTEKRGPTTEPCGRPTSDDHDSPFSGENVVRASASSDNLMNEGLERPTYLAVERNRLSEKKLARKFRLGSSKSRSLPQLQVIGNASLSSATTPVDSEPVGFNRSSSEKLNSDAVMDGMARLDINGSSGFFTTLTRRRLSSPFQKKKNFRSSSRRRSIKASDIVHMQLNTNNSNNNNNNNNRTSYFPSPNQSLEPSPFFCEEKFSIHSFYNPSTTDFTDSSVSISSDSNAICNEFHKPRISGATQSRLNFSRDMAGNYFSTNF